MTAKERHRCKLLEYLGNPENPFPNRLQMGKDVLKFKNPAQLYVAFNLEELSEIEKEGLELRRQKYASQLAKVDKGLLEKAAAGDAAAAKLVYQRFEQWSEKIDLNHKGAVAMQLSPEDRAIAEKAAAYAAQEYLKGKDA